ncbi:hypothetical protein HUN08_06590 [Gordonia sp. X0973]|uniref:hypothetical protein n=1 Tax=Gordonia sp. X0973 TaxID=2742602 RepID=UPI000F53D042|nr:hypothetical protein [Gordonia sp. X0973]QKT06893.1 hypothetical protein HUN08_06590 [Gordonia sp. X0973]
MTARYKVAAAVPLVALALGMGGAVAAAAPQSGDPGGKPCQNQDGARGHYMWSNTGNYWYCNIDVRNAPKYKKKAPPPPPFGS